MTFHPGNRYRRRGHPGFTLVELLTVLCILSIVGGLSAGAFHLARKSYVLSASASRVEGTIRAARNAAIATGVPSRVVVDPVAGEAIAYAFETVGEWSFEDLSEGIAYGARRAPAVLRGGASIQAGHLGRGLHLGGTAHADCGSLPAYDLRSGVYAEAWIRWQGSPVPAPAPGAGTRRVGSDLARGPARPAPLLDSADIIAKGGSYSLGIGPDGSLEGRVGEYRVRTVPDAVVPGRWTRVALRYDGEEVLLFADGIERETYLVEGLWGGASHGKNPGPPALIPPSREPLTIGSPRNSFPGEIDEVRLHGLVEPLRYSLGGGERFLGWRKVIRFDRRGRLDPRFHETEVQVVLCAEEGEREPHGKTEAAVDYSVTFAEWARRRGLVVSEGSETGLSEAGELARLQRKFAGARQVLIKVDPSGALR